MPRALFHVATSEGRRWARGTIESGPDALLPTDITLDVDDDTTSTDQMRRSFDELAAYLGRALSFPAGAFLMTGTGIVPDPPFTLEAGDVVTIAVDGLGALTNTVERLDMRA
jgi:2-keto-4-pentenoate hydratase/2-oxohepta-3-ene-1,7-dioic acid hydratase in catechol pathway